MTKQIRAVLELEHQYRFGWIALQNDFDIRRNKMKQNKRNSLLRILLYLIPEVLWNQTEPM